MVEQRKASASCKDPRTWEMCLFYIMKEGDYSMFGVFKKAAKAAATEVKAEYGANLDFLQAVVAASALVAYADGDLEDSEKTKAISIIANHSVLGKLYNRDVIESTVSEYFKKAVDASGRNALARELDDVRGKTNGTQMAEDAYLVALDIANADGEVEAAEEAVLKKIAARLNVDTSKFDF